MGIKTWLPMLCIAASSYAGDLESSLPPKPKALVVSAAEDSSDTFSGEYADKFYSDLAEHYAITKETARTDVEVFDYIRRNSDARLVILAAHGTPSVMSFGERDVPKRLFEIGATPYDSEEKKYLDLTDHELEGALSTLPLDSKIVLISCFTANGGEPANNIANFVKHSAGARHILAPQYAITLAQIQVRSYVPFDAEMMACNMKLCLDNKYER